MTMPRLPKNGGFLRPVRLGEFIRDSLSSGRITWANELYREYKQKMEAIPLSDKRAGTRRVMSVNSFFIYLYACRKLNLLEYVDLDGNPVPNVKVKGIPAIKGRAHITEPGYIEYTDDTGKVISDAPPRAGLYGKLYFHIIPGQENSSDWTDPMGRAGFRS